MAKATKFLVTGGAGFIGSHLVDALIKRGASVVVLDNFSNGSRDKLQDALETAKDQLTILEGDIRDLETCRAACEGTDGVFHEAALGSISRSVETPLETHAVNATGTLNMLIAAREAKVKRFVFASSSSVYGSSKVIPRIEMDMPQPISPYSVSKLVGEDYCLSFLQTYGLETICLRYFNIFGSRQNAQSQYAAVVPRFIDAFLRGQSPVIYGDGEQSRDFTYVENAVNANLAAMDAPRESCGRNYNVGCGRRYSVNELCRTIRRILGILGTSSEPQHTDKRAGDVRESLADIALADRWLGYRPSIDFEEGLKRTVEAYRKGFKTD